MATTEKISVTIGREELRGAKHLATKLGLSLSTFISDAVRQRIEQQARQEAGLAVLDTFAPEDLASAAEMKDLLERWRSGAPPLEPRRRRQRSPRQTRRPKPAKKTSKSR